MLSPFFKEHRDYCTMQQKNPVLCIRKYIVDKGRDYTRGATFVVLILTTDLSHPHDKIKKIRQLALLKNI